MTEPANKKDAWDRLTALATILVPAAIALAGHFISQGLQQAEIASENRRADQNNAIAQANTKIAQASLINTLMKSLTSKDPQERRLAVQSVLIALPEQGPALVQIVAQTDKDKDVQAAAKTSLQERVHSLVRDLFASEATVRVSAAQDLLSGWRNDSKVVSLIVDFATEHKDNSNGVYNSVVVLNDFSPRALAENRDKVVNFAEIAKATGAKTKVQAEILAKRVRG